MFPYRTPGVYFEWQDNRSRVITGMRTDIAGFVGIAERGPLHQPVKISSWTQFISVFGHHIEQGYLAYAVQGFFANGGQDCWVVRAADQSTASAAYLTVKTYNGEVLFTIEASSCGVWGQDITVLLQRTNEKCFNLFIKLPDGTQELWRDIALEPYNTSLEKENARNIALVLYDPRNENVLDTQQLRKKETVDARSGSQLVRVLPDDRSGFDTNSTLLLPRGWSIAMGTLKGGTDGLATLTLNHLIGTDSPNGSLWGLANFNLIEEIGVVAIPDSVATPPAPITQRPTISPKCDVDDIDRFLAMQPQFLASMQRESQPPRSTNEVLVVQQALVTHCELLKDRVALLDPLSSDTDPNEIINHREDFDSAYAALYYPWIGVLDPNNQLRWIPPCGHVAGMFARVDNQIGVHKPPANEVLESAHNLGSAVDDVTHGILNESSINVIRAISGRGIRVMGARTLSSDPLWRYINVRRLIIMIEDSIEANTQWIVFESSNYALWSDTVRVVHEFLNSLWRRGILDGATADEAFHVICDETNNPPSEQNTSRMVCEIGVQPPWPAEYVVIRIGKTEGSAEILEEKPNG